MFPASSQNNVVGMWDTHIYRVGKGFSRDLSGKEVIRQKYFFAFEGQTEYEYFKGIKDSFIIKNKKGMSVDLQLIHRDFCNKDRSDPKYNMTVLKDYVHALSNPGEVAPGIALEKVLEEVYQRNKKLNYQFLHNLFLRLLEKICNSDAFDGKYISDVDMFMGICVEYLVNNGISYDIAKHLEFPKYDLGYKPDIDKLCLVVDRDYCGIKNKEWENPPRDNDYYKELVKDCHENKVRLFVSNPCFEMWLIMHYEESIDLSDKMRDNLFRNRKEEDGEKASFHVLCDIIESKFNEKYRKYDINFEKWFKPYVGDAVDNAVNGDYCTDVSNLIREIGSNLGILLKDIIPKE